MNDVYKRFKMLTVTLLITLKSNMESSILQEYEKPQYRTIAFSSEKITDEYLKKYQKVIEEYEIDDNNYMLVFKTKKALDSFKKENKDLLNNATVATLAQDKLNIVMSNVLKVIIIISFLIMTIIMIVLNYNYYCNISKDIALYNILGYSKSQVILICAIFFHFIYAILNCIILIIIKIISLKFKFELVLSNYYLSFIIIFMSLIVTYLISYNILRKKNNLITIKE